MNYGKGWFGQQQQQQQTNGIERVLCCVLCDASCMNCCEGLISSSSKQAVRKKCRVLRDASRMA
jgi:hypothetical protein